jgi:hypothetical protein
MVMLYLAFAAYAWFDFTRINHDGLANVGLFLVTAPVTVLELLLSANSSWSLVPHGHGYLLDHAFYYFPAVAATALLIAAAGRLVRRAIAPASGEPKHPEP